MVKVEWRGDALTARARSAALEVARQTAEIIKGESVNRAPLEYGTLRGSATVNSIENGSEISYNTPYALVMHEDESYTPSHAGTGPNYLRGPLLEAEEQYHKDVANAMKAIFG